MRKLVNTYTAEQCALDQISKYSYAAGKKGEKEDYVIDFYNSCVENYQVTYDLKKVFKSYKDGLKKYCHRSLWSSVGKKLGLEGQEFDSEVEKIKVCQVQNINSALSGLKTGHRDGLKKFCHKHNWEPKGLELGRKAGDLSIYHDKISICSLNNVGSAKNSLERGYKNGLRYFCKNNKWDEQILHHAVMGKPIDEIRKEASLCVIYKVDRKAAMRVENRYKGALSQYCSNDYAYEMGITGNDYNVLVCPSHRQKELQNQYDTANKPKKELEEQSDD